MALNDAVPTSGEEKVEETAGTYEAPTPPNDDSVVDPGCGDHFDTIMGVEEDSTPSTSAGLNQTSLPKKKSGIFGASSNLVNSIVGAGIIGIPYALRQSGLVTGVLLLILVAYLTDKSLRMIVDMATFHPQLRTRGIMTYEDLASFPFGRIGSGFILFNMFVLAYGAMVAYLLIIKDTVPTIIGFDNGIEREIVLVITSLLVVVPLSMQRDMASLSFTSLLSVIADVILVIFIAAYSPIKETVSEAGGFGEVLKNSWVNSTLFIGLGILSTAMACQHSCFVVSQSLTNKTRARWAAVTYRSLSAATILCLVLGICGYLGFLDDTMGNVLNNFDPDSMEANGARALLAITMFFTYPMESFVARHVLIKLIHNGDIDGHAGEEIAVQTEQDSGVPSGHRFRFLTRREKWTLFLYVSALIPALIVNDLGPVLSITGSLGGSCISYMAPGMVYLGVHGEEFLAMTAKWLQNHHQKKSTDGATADIELPVAGDSKATMQPQPAPVYPEGSKPWWWYVALMPIWCWIASKGSANMKEKLAQTEAHVFTRSNSEANPHGGLEDEEDVEATTRDFFISIFFIVFGVIAAVAGVGSNIYVQINNIFFSPH